MTESTAIAPYTIKIVLIKVFTRAVYFSVYYRDFPIFCQRVLRISYIFMTFFIRDEWEMLSDFIKRVAAGRFAAYNGVYRQGRAASKKIRKISKKRGKTLDFFFRIWYIIQAVRKLSSAGRASALQAEGHRFDPYSFHHNSADS